MNNYVIYCVGGPIFSLTLLVIYSQAGYNPSSPQIYSPKIFDSSSKQILKIGQSEILKSEILESEYGYKFSKITILYF